MTPHQIWICMVCQAPQSAETAKAWRKGRITTCDECELLSKLTGIKITSGDLYVWDDEHDE